MFYYLATHYVDLFSYFNLFNYITFRTGAAILTSLFFSLIFGELIISKLTSFQPKGQPIRSDGPANHLIEKIGTPTMGGVLILSSMMISIIFWADLSNNYLWICILSSFFFGLIGFIDDYKKIKYQNHEGLDSKIRLFLQFIFSLIIVYLMPKSLSNCSVICPFTLC